MAHFLIVEARFYDHLNDMLLAGARQAPEDAGHAVAVLTVPGALEVPGAIAAAATSGYYEGFVALGVVIRGETYHFEIVAGESARGIMALTLDGMAIGNGMQTGHEGVIRRQRSNNVHGQARSLHQAAVVGQQHLGHAMPLGQAGTRAGADQHGFGHTHFSQQHRAVNRIDALHTDF